MNITQMNEKVKTLLNRLGFNECINLFKQLPQGNPMINLVFDRMEEIDPEKFERFLDGKTF